MITMAIMDDIKGTITKTGKSAVKKTKDLAEIAKLTSEIEETKSLIKGVYVEIGKKYCELFDRETASNEFTIDVATVENLQSQLETLKIKRLALRGKVVCEKCDRAVDDEYSFCSFCGAKLPEKAAEEEAEDVPEIPEICDADEEIDD